MTTPQTAPTTKAGRELIEAVEGGTRDLEKGVRRALSTLVRVGVIRVEIEAKRVARNR